MSRKLFTPTRLMLAFVLLCTLYFTALTLRGPQPALTILHYGKPAANIVVKDPLSDDQWTTNANGTIHTSYGDGLPKFLTIPFSDGTLGTTIGPWNGHTIIDLRGRYTKTTRVRFQLGTFKSTNSSEQFTLADGELEALERGEVTHEKLHAKALEEAGLSD